MRSVLSIIISLAFSVLFFINVTDAQQNKPAFWDEIQQFKKEDSLHSPGTGKILFVGSSSFRMWKDVQNYFPDYQIINRGFGGSSLPDVIRYRDDIIFKYKPKQIVIYCGENDFAASDTVTVNTVVNRFKHLYTLIREKYKKVPIVFVSIKPSPSRAQLMYKFDTANKLIQLFLKPQKNTGFVDVYHSMLDNEGAPIKDIFIKDNLHMNAKGYAIWRKLIEPHLLR